MMIHCKHSSSSSSSSSMIEDQEKGCSIVEMRMRVSLMKSRQRTAVTRKIIARMKKVSFIVSPPSTGGREEEGVPPPTKKPRLNCVSPTNASCSISLSSSSTSMVSTDGGEEESLSSTNTTTEKETSPPTSIRELIATKGILPRLLQQTFQLPMSDSFPSTDGPQRHGGMRLTEIMSKRKRAAALCKKHQGIKSPLLHYPSFQSTPIATFLRQSSWGSTDSACSSPFVSSQQTNAITRHCACIGGAHGAHFCSSFR